MRRRALLAFAALAFSENTMTDLHLDDHTDDELVDHLVDDPAEDEVIATHPEEVQHG